MNIKVTADSTCDLSAELIAANDIQIIPLYIIKDGRQYKDGLEITPDDIYAYAQTTGEMCSTAAINEMEYVELFERCVKEYDGVIHINISNEFSVCNQNALRAAEQFENVRVIDSRNLSTGSGHVVLRAVELAKEGKDLDQIAEELKAYTERVEASFVVDKLDYLKKGGRCSSLAALGANLLRLRPCIEVKSGKMGVGKKYQGSFVKCLKKYVDDRLTDRQDIDTSRIFITHSGCSDEVIAMVREEVEKLAKFDEILITRAGCTVSSHCGPNTLGILFARKS